MDRQRLGFAFVFSITCGSLAACGTSSGGSTTGPGEEAGAVATADAGNGMSADGAVSMAEGGVGIDAASTTVDAAGSVADAGDATVTTADAGPGMDAGDATTTGGDAGDAASGADAADGASTGKDAASADASPADAASAGKDAASADASPDAATDGSCTVAAGSTIGVFTDPDTVTPIAPPNPPGITFEDTDGNLVNAHGGGIIKVCDTFYLHGEYFLSTTTDNDFNGFSMYSSKDLATWKNEGIILPQQASGQLGPNRKGERPHIIQCPSTGEYVLYAHSADVTYEVDKEVVYATSPTVNGTYTFQGSLLNSKGAIAAHSDMSALSDGNNAYVVTESGWVYPLATDCHSWLSATQYSAVNGTTGGSEAPTVFKAGNTYYWIGSNKTGWQANDDFYSTAPAMTGPWTYQGYIAPVGTAGTAADKLTWMTQSTWVMPVAGSQGTVYMYWGDHWDGQNTSDPGQHNYLTTYVFQPLVFTGTLISMPTYQVSWKLDVGAGTWTTN